MLRVWLCICWCFLTVGPVLAANGPEPVSSTTIERFRLYGRDYLRLKDWARVTGLEISQSPRSKDLVLTGRSVRIGLTEDSNRAQFNGTRVMLCYPVVESGNALYVSALDAQYTFRPLLFPPGNQGRPLKTIVLDPGHGGRDPGNQEGSAQEKKLTLQLAQELQTQLVKAGYKVYLTRSGDEFIELEDRPQIARRRNADLFISLHFNSAAAGVSGIETYCMTPSGASSSNAGGQGVSSLSSPGNLNNTSNVKLAYQLHRTLVRALDAEDRGVKRARFAVLREANVPAVLIEGGFMSNPAEGKRIGAADYRRKLAKAIVDGIQNYRHALAGPRDT